MDSLEDYFFGPLDKRYCVLFYVFTIINFLFFILAIVVSARGLFNMVNKKGFGLSLMEVFSMLYALAFSFIFYIQSRLLYSMCVNSNMNEAA